MKKAYHGRCRCGAVRIECQLDLAEGTSECNCSICTKTRFWKAIVKADGFRYCREKMFCRTTGSAEAPYITSSAAAAA